MTKVLIITYYWPPSGGAGVQRWLKFSKYLPEFGWEPVILTVSTRNAAYSVTDPSLEAELPHELKVHRTKATDWYRFYSKDKSKIPSAGFANIKDDSIKGRIYRFIRGNFFIPDPRKGWNRHAYKIACELIVNEQISHVVTTSPPHSTQLIGLKLKNKFHEIKWISDLRDPWTEIYYYQLFYPTLITKFIDSRYEKKVVRNADTVITVGKSLAAMIQAINNSDNKKIHVITNGYDEDDFLDIKKTTPEKFTITYVGTLSEVYPVDAFLSALGMIKSRGIEFILRFVGSVNETIRQRIIKTFNHTDFEFIPYTSHKEAINYMAISSMLLLIIPGNINNKVIVTGKLFEYLASEKHILFIGPVDGDAADHLRNCGHTGIFNGQDPEEIERYVLKNMKSRDSISQNEIVQYSRRFLTGKLADILSGY